ncbi:MAG: histidine phosphatase family protein [Nocardioides marinisabuli]|uniref:histidine phosphatase family protein n=1 Tax=Nocardioides marinisabuli TaxID=419476 RepID=UPI003218F313
MVTLHLLVHPEATHVVEGLVGGWYDAALTARGEAQAAAAAAALATALAPALGAGERVAVVSSDLRRCRRTAEAVTAALARVAGRAPAVALDAGLREQSYGEAEGHPVGTHPWRPPGPGDDALHHHDGVPGSETRAQVVGRAHAAVQRHLAAAPEHLVVVTHGGTATYAVTAWLGLPLEVVGRVRFATPPGSITTLREDPATGDRRVEVLGDVRHLDAP